MFDTIIPTTYSDSDKIPIPSKITAYERKLHERCKDPGPEAPALVHPSFRLVERGDVVNVVYQSSGFRCQVSGVRCQRDAKRTSVTGFGILGIRPDIIRSDVVRLLILAQPLAFGAVG